MDSEVGTLVFHCDSFCPNFSPSQDDDVRFRRLFSALVGLNLTGAFQGMSTDEPVIVSEGPAAPAKVGSSSKSSSNTAKVCVFCFAVSRLVHLQLFLIEG